MNHWDRMSCEHRERMRALLVGVLFGIIVGGCVLLALECGCVGRQVTVVFLVSLGLWGGACRAVLR